MLCVKGAVEGDFGGALYRFGLELNRLTVTVTVTVAELKIRNPNRVYHDANLEEIPGLGGLHVSGLVSSPKSVGT